MDWLTAFNERAEDYWDEKRLHDLLQGKQLTVTPANAAPLLRVLGLLHRDASMPDKERRKFFQLNHMIRALRPAFEELEGPITIVDAGCGRAYLTLALSWWLQTSGRQARVVGIERRADLVEESQRRAADLGLENAQFLEGDLHAPPESLADLDVSAVLGLHACDTATDAAIRIGLHHNAQLIAVAPCCHAELAAGWKALEDSGEQGAWAPIWGAPHLRRETAASITDTYRMLLMRAAGYDVAAVEFVASNHTPKNTLIRGMKRHDVQPEFAHQYEELRESTGGVGIRLEHALQAVIDDARGPA